MPTKLSAIVSRTRTQILAPLIQTGAVGPDEFFAEDEMLDHAIAGCRDLWRAIVDLHQEHFMTVDETNVSLVASTSTMTGVPKDLFRVLLIQSRDTTSTSSSRTLRFTPSTVPHGSTATVLGAGGLRT